MNASRNIHTIKVCSIDTREDAETLRDIAIETLEYLSNLVIKISECDDIKEVNELLEDAQL